MNTKMSIPLPAKTSHASLSVPAAAALILALWLFYTGLQALIAIERLSQPYILLLEFIPGLLGLAILFISGFSANDCFLRIRPLSKKGMVAFLVSLPLLLRVFLIGTWTGWNTLEILIYAPAKAVSQELFFRCTVFPLFLWLFSRRSYLAIFLTALSHGLWHVCPLSTGQAPIVVLSVMAVPFLGGLAWNWQVRRDHTAIWVTIYHILIDQAMSLFWS